MRDYDNIDPHGFIEILRALPDSPANVRAYLLGEFQVIVTSDDPAVWWKALEQDRGEVGAADAVSHLALKMGGPRLIELMKAAVNWEETPVRADDSRLVRTLFEGYEDWEYPVDQVAISEETQRYVIQYYEENASAFEETDTPPSVETTDNPPSFDQEDSTEEDSDDSTLDLIAGKPRKSAWEGAEFRFERVQIPEPNVSVPQKWLEKQLEDFIYHQWDKIDLGFDTPLHVVDRQKQLTDGRVDLYARGGGGLHFLIELKIGEASARDWGQLTSYMGDIQKGGVEFDKIRGVLIAPSFHKKVLNSATADRRVTLLRFDKEPK